MGLSSDSLVMVLKSRIQEQIQSIDDLEANPASHSLTPEDLEGLRKERADAVATLQNAPSMEAIPVPYSKALFHGWLDLS